MKRTTAAATMHRPRWDCGPRSRSGMLLLIVLLMLSLFLGIGAILLTIAARARAAARVSAAVNAPTAFGDALVRDAADQALTALLRGVTSATNGSIALGGPPQECLLADKHGPSTTGTCTTIQNPTSNVMTLYLEGLMPAVPTDSAELNGRLLTMRPSPQRGDICSFRIVGSSVVGTTVAVYVSQLPTFAAPVLPTPPFPIVINARDYMPVPGSSVDGHDAFDLDNVFLAQPVIAGGVFSGSFSRLSYAPTLASAAATVDNDNDGVNDGVWLSGTVVPSLPSPLGGQITFDVSCLVVDLDGKLNLNAAGTGRQLASGSFSGAPTAVPTGMGYGPADVNPSIVLPPTATPAVLPLVSSSLATTLILGGTPATSLASPTTSQRRMPPRLGNVDGRYGRTSGTSVAGRPGDDPEAAQRTSSANYAALIGGNSRADVSAKMKVFMTGAATAPVVLNFQAPNGDSSGDWIDDPYEVRLDGGQARLGTARRPQASAGQYDDSLFSLAELERVLRPNDVDAPQLPPRLAAVLGDSAQRLRMLVTTDSWDTPALTGTAASLIHANLLQKTASTASTRIAPPKYPWNAANAASPDVAAGLRFNINRPVAAGSANDAAQQAYCRGLYTLIAALRPDFDRARAAQWAANVLDFRDTDSRMTRFRYATDLTAGWPATLPAEVWGTERPDLVITAVANNGTAVTSITLMSPYNAVVVGSGATETVDPSLIFTGSANTVDLKKTVGVGDSIWRLRTSTTGTMDGKNLTVSPFGPHQSQTVTLSPPLPLNGATTVVLERLADPASPYNATTNPYRPVDEEPVSFAAGAQDWIHWPNRPFVSQAELLLVGSGTTTSMVAGGSTPTGSVAIDVPEVLDATHVPTLFAGHAVMAPSTTVAVVGLDQVALHNLPTWREPGRINVNTIPTGTPGVPLDNVVWSALVGSDTPAVNPVPLPIKTLGQLLAPPSPLAARAFADARDRNPFFSRSLAIRLGSTATIRSHVFAIWITVRVSDTSPGAPSPITKRLFAIVDRSIPVGYLPGIDLNVRDMIRLRTFID